MSVEEPVTVKRSFSPGDDNTVTTHAAFGQISTSRVSGRATLYGSDFVHQNTIRITIHRSELNRNLSHDWFFSKEDIVEVEMSEAQWAAFVSSHNVGGGVPCTLRYVQNDHVPFKPQLPDPDLKRTYKSEVMGTVQDSIRHLRNLETKLTEATSKYPKKTQTDLLGEIRMAIQELNSNIPFVTDSFDKHMETSVEKAKVEVHAYVNNVLVHVGLEAVQGKVLQLESKDEER